MWAAPRLRVPRASVELALLTAACFMLPVARGVTPISSTKNQQIKDRNALSSTAKIRCDRFGSRTAIRSCHKRTYHSEDDYYLVRHLAHRRHCECRSLVRHGRARPQQLA